MTPASEETPFAVLAEVVERLEATSKRLEKRAILGVFLRSLRREEVAPAVHLVIGRSFAEVDPRVLNVGWATLRKASSKTKQTSLEAEPLTILEVSRAFAQIAAAIPEPFRGLLIGMMEKIESGMRHLLSTVESIPNSDDILFQVAELERVLRSVSPTAAMGAMQEGTAPGGGMMGGGMMGDLGGGVA